LNVESQKSPVGVRTSVSTTGLYSSSPLAWPPSTGDAAAGVADAMFALKILLETPERLVVQSTAA
jgi:hypothetical protein